MIKREVIRSRKSGEKDITALGNPFEFWHPKLKNEIISEIETGLYYYFIKTNNSEIEIKINQGENGKFLTTDSWKNIRNYLLELPDC